MSKHIETLSQEQRSKRILTFTFAVIAIFYVLPIMLVLINSLKSNSYVNMETFALPSAKSFVGLDNYKAGMTFGNYPFVKSALYSLFITIVSSMLILICTSMAAWYIARVGSLFSRIVYYLCVFSMVVPFQMVMFTLAKTADTLKLNTPWTIPIVYLGFGAGLAVFMFTGFVKALPLEIEEAAAIDGCEFPHAPNMCHRRLRPPAYFLQGGVPHAQAYNDFRRCAGDHVGMERLPPAVSCAGYK